MARPKFYVKHFIACQNAAWDGVAGPDTSRTLEGVNYQYRVPPDTEFPFEMPELWLYARFLRTNQAAGEREVTAELWWHDSPTGVVLLTAQPPVAIRFSTARSAVHQTWAFRPLALPGEGLYEFRLMCPSRRPWEPQPRRLASEYIRIRR
jgi:hypothetical protein